MKDIDLDSADWLCFFTKSMVNKVNPFIHVHISKFKDNNGVPTKRLIHISNISEEDIVKLKFLTNTNENNNYLYLEKFSVELDNGEIRLNIPGLSEVLLEFWRCSDSYAFEKGEKFFKPFSDITNINRFIDNYTDLHPSLPKTFYKEKKYVIILNPDCGDYLYECTNNAGVCCSHNDCCKDTSDYYYCQPSGNNC